MITESLSAWHTAPAEPLPVVKVTNPRGRAGSRRRQRRHREHSTLCVHEASMIESKQIKPRIGDKSTVMLTVPRQRDRNTANTHEYREHDGSNGEVKTHPALPLNEQPCRKRWRGGEEALCQTTDKRDGSESDLAKENTPVASRVCWGCYLGGEAGGVEKACAAGKCCFFRAWIRFGRYSGSTHQREPFPLAW